MVSRAALFGPRNRSPKTWLQGCRPNLASRRHSEDYYHIEGRFWLDSGVWIKSAFSLDVSRESSALVKDVEDYDGSGAYLLVALRQKILSMPQTSPSVAGDQ